MTARRWRHRIAFALVAWLTTQTAGAAVQDALAHAKELYLSAAYDEALAVLDRLRTESPHDTVSEVAQYHLFCLLALNRSEEAQKAIEGIVTIDPFYQPSETQTSPRIRTVFQNTRKALLPSIVQRSYAEARASFEKKDPKAGVQFDQVLALIDDPDMKGGQLSDLRTVVSGFRDLSQAMALAAVPAPAPIPAARFAPSAALEGASAAAAPIEPPAGARPRQAGFVPPVAVSQPLPQWVPALSEARLGFKGSIEVMIDEKGNVTSVELRQSVHPLYDDGLLAAARTWKYKPATRNGVPTPYLKVVDIQLQPVR